MSLPHSMYIAYRTQSRAMDEALRELKKEESQLTSIRDLIVDQLNKLKVFYV